MDLKDITISPINDDKKFERLCLDIWRKKLRNDYVQLHGRSGQKQSGIDIFGQRKNTLEWVGIQCKVKSINASITIKEIEEEIEKALYFNPKLTEYVIATTAQRDQKLQEFARIKTTEHQKKGLFSVAIIFWDDIKYELADESNIDLLYKYYKDLFIDIKLLSNVIGRVIVIEIGVGECCDTRYELFVGKTPLRIGTQDYSGINYYKNMFFIASLSDGTIDNFPLPCYPSDIERVFVTLRDAFIVAKWLSSLRSIDDIIYGNSVEYKSTITQEEFREFIKTYKDNT